jgi:small lipoprotein (TIGR04454 family)
MRFVRFQSPRSLRSKALLGALTLTLAAGCGRKATSADCQLIVDRLIEVEMHAMNTNDMTTIAKKQESIRASMRDELKDCVGRRITDGIMTCVKSAPTTDGILACIR